MFLHFAIFAIGASASTLLDNLQGTWLGSFNQSDVYNFEYDSYFCLLDANRRLEWWQTQSTLSIAGTNLVIAETAVRGTFVERTLSAGQTLNGVIEGQQTGTRSARRHRRFSRVSI